jgi:hypothetical protein
MDRKFVAGIALAITAAMWLGQTSHAATITLSTDAFGQNAPAVFNTPGAQDRDNKNITRSTVDFPFEGLRSSISIGPPPTSGSGPIGANTEASARAFANGDRGALRVDVGAGFSDGGTASGAATAAIDETYTVTGSGTLTTSLKVDGSWFVLPVGGNAFQVQASTCVACNSNGSIRDFFALDLFDGASGSVNEVILTASQTFNAPFAPQQVQVGWDLLTQIFAPGQVDFSNTGRLLIETTGSLIATPSDPSFLSDPIFFEEDPAPIPLPPSALLLLGALGIGRLLAIARISEGDQYT